MSAEAGPEVERWEKELRKGSTKLALLSLLSESESYGYEILNRLKGAGEGLLSSTEATVYPLLHDLEAKGFLASAWRTTEAGVPPRKYYQLTPAGRELLAALRRSWDSFKDAVDDLVDQGGGEA